MRGNLHVRFLGGGDDFQYQVRFWDPLIVQKTHLHTICFYTILYKVYNRKKIV
jgi:hypothetical protein